MLTLKMAYIAAAVFGVWFLLALGLGIVLGTAMAACTWPPHESDTRQAA
jgi:hypothetical protein